MRVVFEVELSKSNVEGGEGKNRKYSWQKRTAQSMNK